MAEPLRAYAPLARAAFLRAVLAAACRATGHTVQIEFANSGPLYRRIRDEPALADLAFGFGPYVLELCAREDLLEVHEPRISAFQDGRSRLGVVQPEQLWHILDFALATAHGEPPAASLEGLLAAEVAHLAVPNPLRSETGMLLLLATMDQEPRPAEVGARGWDWWELRSQRGITLANSPDEALALASAGSASHALVLSSVPSRPGATPVTGLPAIPHTMAILTRAPHLKAARELVDWLSGPEGGAAVQANGGLSAWHAPTNGLDSYSATVPALDVAWAFGQYRRSRTEWARKYPRDELFF